jgi:virginiamycin A acetyltransferase
MIARILRALQRRIDPPQATPLDPTFMAENPMYTAYHIGEWSYGKPRVLSWGEGTKLCVGRFCSMAENVVILLGGEHHVDWVSTYPFNILFTDATVFSGHPHTKGDVVIGNDVWIGRDALILSGVTVGDGSVIGARSVVTHDVPPYAIVAGNPARLVRFRFSEHTCEALQQIAWWNWPLSKIKEAWPLLLSQDIEEFIARYYTDATHAIERHEPEKVDAS